MAARPIGFSKTMQQVISGTPPPQPNKGGIPWAAHTPIEEQNRIRTAANRGAPAQIPSRMRPTLRRGEMNLEGAGRIVSPAKGTGRIFMFNPNDVTDTKGISWGTIEIPGASHPVYQFGAGGERLITFDLYIDGDRGRFGRAQARDNSTLSIMDELKWYRSLVHPKAYGMQFADVAPWTILFTFGELYNNVPCVVKQANWKINYWVPGPSGPRPVRATIPIVLGEIPQQSITADQV